MQIKVKELKHLFNAKTPNEFLALKGVNTEINQGEYIGIIGQTGSGKTTFIEHLNALLLPTGGTIEWFYKKETLDKKTKSIKTEMETFQVKPSFFKKVKKAKAIRKRVGVVFQFAEYQLFEETIEKDIAFGPKSFGTKKDEANKLAAKYLEMVGLDQSFLTKSPFNLSGGQKRRVALAGILAMEPDVLIADEPTAGLDPVGVREILNIFKKLNQAGKTIIIVTHDLDNVLEETDRVLLFKDGQIIKDGNTYEVLENTKFLEENDMIPPKLLAFANKLREHNIDVPKVRSVDELAQFLDSYLSNKRGGQ